MLDIWPALPLIINSEEVSTGSVDNIVAALECSDRVCHISLWTDTILDCETFLAAMQQPFPELTNLKFRWGYRINDTVVVPDSFLGGFAPRLENLLLSRVPFPGLPKLLLSTTHLVTLELLNVPHSGYFSPDAMVAALSTLTDLEYFRLEFESPESCPDLETRRLPPSTRFVLPVLQYFLFKGVIEYFEDLVTDIDAPQLGHLRIIFFNDILFDTPQLIRFVSRSPISSALEKAHISLGDKVGCVTFRSQRYGSLKLKVSILCEGLDWQLSSLEQVCTSCLPFLSTSEDLYIHEHPGPQPDWKDNIANRAWLELLRPFTALKDLYISEKFALRGIGLALRKLVEGGATEVFPTLKRIYLEGLESSGPVQEVIGQLVAARQVSSNPVIISRWASPKEDKTRIFG